MEPGTPLARRHLRARALAGGVALACLAGTSAAGATDSGAKTSSLAWVRMPGSEACVSAQELARAVEQRLGREVFVPTSRADLSIEARVEPLPGKKGHKATILVRGPAGETLGERTLEEKDPSCARLAEPLALVLALLIDPDAASRPSPAPAPAPAPERTGPVPVPVPAPDPPAPPPAPAPAPDLSRAFRFEGTLVTTVVTGLVPGPAFGFGGSSVLQLPRVPVSLRGSGAIFVPVTEERAGVKAAFDLGMVGGWVCPTTYVGERLRLLACLGSQLGVGRARAQPPFVSDDAYRLLWNVAGEGRAAVQVAGPLVIALSAGAAIPILRGDLELDRAPGSPVVVHQLAPVAFTSELGLGVVVP